VALFYQVQFFFVGFISRCGGETCLDKHIRDPSQR